MIQNADDCEYIEKEPCFSLIYDDNILKTEYNEIGFKKANVRAITAIGESTKRVLLNSAQSIGEKGVGFKTIFAIASEVEIHSGEFNFRLKEATPTIPEIIQLPTVEDCVNGTAMFFKLKKPLNPSFLTEAKVLKLCLCLRRLKKIMLKDFNVTIADYNDERVITINGNEYRFLKSVYVFNVDDEVLAEREKGSRYIGNEQKIYCYIPLENKRIYQYCLYSGLPTQISLNAPLCIDAPFEMTTSRDHVLKNRWGATVRDNIYHAITTMLCDYREYFKENILEYIKFTSSSIGNGNVMKISLFDDAEGWLNQGNWLSELKCAAFLPTFDDDVYVTSMQKCKRYPQIVRYLIEHGTRINVLYRKMLKLSDNHIIAMNALGIVQASFLDVIREIKNNLAENMKNVDFRRMLYAYLKNRRSSADYNIEIVKTLKIIPVYDIERPRQTIYVAWEDDKIFTKHGAKISKRDYFILNENLFSKGDLNEILGNVIINEMDDIYERGKYATELDRNIKNINSPKELYEYIVSEYESGHFQKYRQMDFIANQIKKGEIPLKNLNGDVVKGTLYICEMANGYFTEEIINRMIVSDSCLELARAVGLTSLSSIHYSDINLEGITGLSGDEIASFQDDYFDNSIDILSGFVKDKLISQEQINAYHLGVYQGMDDGDTEKEYVFPEDNIRDRKYLRACCGQAFL